MILLCINIFAPLGSHKTTCVASSCCRWRVSPCLTLLVSRIWQSELHVKVSQYPQWTALRSFPFPQSPAHWSAAYMYERIARSSNMKSALASSCTAEEPPKSRKLGKRLPEVLSEFLEIAIFSFGSISGLHSGDKVRGNPILSGVCVMFAQLLSCASPETKEALHQATVQERLPGYEGRSHPAKC